MTINLASKIERAKNKEHKLANVPGSQHLKEMIFKRIMCELEFNLKLIKLIFSLYFDVLLKKKKKKKNR